MEYRVCRFVGDEPYRVPQTFPYPARLLGGLHLSSGITYGEVNITFEFLLTIVRNVTEGASRVFFVTRSDGFDLSNLVAVSLLDQSCDLTSGLLGNHMDSRVHLGAFANGLKTSSDIIILTDAPPHTLDAIVDEFVGHDPSLWSLFLWAARARLERLTVP